MEYKDPNLNSRKNYTTTAALTKWLLHATIGKSIPSFFRTKLWVFVQWACDFSNTLSYVVDLFVTEGQAREFWHNGFSWMFLLCSSAFWSSTCVQEEWWGSISCDNMHLHFFRKSSPAHLSEVLLHASVIHSKAAMVVLAPLLKWFD